MFPYPCLTVISGGKGGSGSDSSEKEVEDMEWEKDIYHDINAEIERKGKLLSQLQKQLANDSAFKLSCKLNKKI